MEDTRGSNRVSETGNRTSRRQSEIGDRKSHRLSQNGVVDVDALRPKSRVSALASSDQPTEANVALAEGAAEHSLGSKLAAEFVGTFFLVLSIGIAVSGGSVFAPVGIGLMLAIQIYTFGAVSGGMFNPAVTLAVLLSFRGKISPKNAAAYMVAQFLGATIAGFISFGITEHTFCFDYRAAELDPRLQGGAGTSFFLELFFTCALCSTVLAAGTSLDTPNDYFGFAIGCTVLASAIANGNNSQGSFNPAVTWGINIANYAREGRTAEPSFGSWAVFTIAPLLGAVLAAGIFRVVRAREFASSEANGVLRPPNLLEQAVGEFCGTFYLVLTIGTVATSGSQLAPTSIGLMLAVQIYTYGSVSGGLFNPAVVLAVLLSGRKKLSPSQCGVYIAAQFFGSLLAAFFAVAMVDKGFYFDDTALTRGSWGASMILEIFFTFALASIVLAAGTSYDAPNQYFGFAIGGVVLAGAHACSGFDQGSFNPAVTFGINIANYTKSSQGPGGAWALFLFAPAIGGCLAAGVFHAVRRQEVLEFWVRESGDVDLQAGAAGKPLSTE
eukprot:TRINITY_DN59861_c0_g1_i1.p1 TRINITY_DN59861_c0_g1~~TRINITY_DN59861_c0_g1_i1.p1  ORF type:complete len:554 (-),score=111.99 TRINITY_DN59861_c0_g1_i1:13-1674(-)